MTPLATSSLRPAAAGIRSFPWRCGPAVAGGGTRAFTLLELLVVIGIIGLLFSMGLPALKGLNQSNQTVAVNRQLLDDLAFARLRAISQRSDVYFVFVPTNLFGPHSALLNDPAELRRLTNLVAGEYTGYAIVSARTAGDQPGRFTPRYLTDWKTLPEGFIFTPAKLTRYQPGGPVDPNPYSRPYNHQLFPFPDSQSLYFDLPCIGFNSLGQLISQRDEVIAISKGSVFPPRDKADHYLFGNPPDVQLIPPRPDNVQFIRLSWLTGRANAELPQFEKTK